MNNLTYKRGLFEDDKLDRNCRIDEDASSTQIPEIDITQKELRYEDIGKLLAALSDKSLRVRKNTPEQKDNWLKLMDQLRHVKALTLATIQKTPSFKGNYATSWFKQLQLLYNAHVIEHAVLDKLNNDKDFIKAINDYVKEYLESEKPVLDNAELKYLKNKFYIEKEGFQLYPPGQSHDILNSNDLSRGFDIIKLNNSDNKTAWETGISNAKSAAKQKKLYQSEQGFKVEVKGTTRSKGADKASNFHSADLVIIYDLSTYKFSIRINLDTTGKTDSGSYSRVINLNRGIEKIPDLYRLEIKDFDKFDQKMAAWSAQTDDVEKKEKQLDKSIPPKSSNIEVNKFENFKNKEIMMRHRKLIEGRSAWEVSFKDPELIAALELIPNDNGSFKVHYNNYDKIRHLRGDKRKEVRIEALKRAKAIIAEIEQLPSSAYNFKKDVEITTRAKLDSNEMYGDAAGTARMMAKQSMTGEIPRDCLVDVEAKALCGAIVMKYFEERFNEIEAAKKDSSKRALINLSDEELELCKEWIKEHTRSIVYKFPDNDDNIYVGSPMIPENKPEERNKSNKATEKRWEDALNSFKAKFPDAVEGVDYELRPTSNLTAQSAINADMMNPSAEITFDVRVTAAPDYVKKMIDDQKSLNPDATKRTSSMTTEKNVSSLGFVNCVVYKLFNGDLHFYKKSDIEAF